MKINLGLKATLGNKISVSNEHTFVIKIDDSV